MVSVGCDQGLTLQQMFWQAFTIMDSTNVHTVLFLPSCSQLFASSCRALYLLALTLEAGRASCDIFGCSCCESHMQPLQTSERHIQIDIWMGMLGQCSSCDWCVAQPTHALQCFTSDRRLRG